MRSGLPGTFTAREMSLFNPVINGLAAYSKKIGDFIDSEQTLIDKEESSWEKILVRQLRRV